MRLWLARSVLCGLLMGLTGCGTPSHVQVTRRGPDSVVETGRSLAKQEPLYATTRRDGGRAGYQHFIRWKESLTTNDSQWRGVYIADEGVTHGVGPVIATLNVSVEEGSIDLRVLRDGKPFRPRRVTAVGGPESRYFSYTFVSRGPKNPRCGHAYEVAWRSSTGGLATLGEGSLVLSLKYKVRKNYHEHCGVTR